MLLLAIEVSLDQSSLIIRTMLVLTPTCRMQLGYEFPIAVSHGQEAKPTAAQ
jgi:hypothetical protein